MMRGTAPVPHPRVLAMSGAALLLAACLTGCAKARPIAGDTRGCPTWQQGDLSNGTASLMGDVFSANCVSCHSGPTPAAHYDLSSYLGVLGIPMPLDPNYTNPSPPAVAGNESSRLVKVLDPATADATHAPFTHLHPDVAQWVGQCQLCLLYTSDAADE